MDSLDKLVDDVADIIMTGPGIPSGHLYAMLMGSMTYDEFIRFQSMVLKTGKVKLKNHFLSKA